MPRSKKQSGPAISLISIFLAITGLLLVSKLSPFQVPSYISAEACSAASLFFCYAAFLRNERWLFVLIALILGASALLMANWVILVVLLIVPCLPYLRFGGGGSELFEGYIGLLVAGAAVAVLPFFGISLVFVLIVAIAIYAISVFFEAIF